MEKWKDIPGYSGYYQVSNLGRVKSCKRIIIDSLGRKHTYRERILKPTPDEEGYLGVTLSINGKSSYSRVHRLVAEIFVQNANNFSQINHIDENRSNNKSNNLEWCNSKYNLNYGNRSKNNSNARKNHPNLSKPVYQYNKDLKLIKEWPSLCECGRNGFTRTLISKVCSGKNKSHKGFIWSHKKL
ncbi:MULTISPECIES: NUMOD4 domain-containing protein [unclassified Clostridium]|uniref:NUMOD4 domain-containing protein n=1 Tax=unclassified Clostridium TaxID=2614128 RepID=UPI000297ACDC|nr:MULTISPECIES: NUMOD4 domain-containing protein [unclassified Clostridium]EKQ56339.1 MAG: NUMOD4 motif containing protein [Clostridium sp. Maddingley MBC34-26]